jgi:copper chaperone
MKRKFKIDGIGLGCGGCKKRVIRTLEEHPEIEKIKVFLNPKGIALIKMKKDLSIEELQKQLNKIEGYTITEI